MASRGPIDPAAERALQAAVESWKRHGARSWKETMLEVSPPVLLIPAYDLFLRLMRLLPRRDRTGKEPTSRS
jgi:hypothetical protein